MPTLVLESPVVADFWAIAHKHRGLFISHAQSLIRFDPHDCVQDALLTAYQCLSDAPDMGDESAVCKWICGFIANACRQERALRAEMTARRHTRPCETFTEENDQLTKIEQMHEARFRLRFANLSPMQLSCLTAYLDGEIQTNTARRLGITQQAVCIHFQRAQAKLMAVPADALHTPDVDGYKFRLNSAVYTYHAPTTTGAALSREKLEALR